MSISKKKQAFDIWDIPKIEREDQGYPSNNLKLAQYLGVSRGSVIRWEKEYMGLKNVSSGDSIREEVLANFLSLSKRSPAAGQALLKELSDENRGSEVELSAADYIRLARAARDRILGLSGEVGRDISLCEQSPLLLGEVCGNPEQDDNGGSEVGELGLPN